MSTDWGEAVPGTVARPVQKSDAVALQALLDAAEQVDQTGEAYDVDDVEEELDDPRLDVERGTIGLWHDGRMIGYAIVRVLPNASEVDRVRGEGVVHPDFRGRRLGAALVDWQLAAAPGAHERVNPGVPAVLSISGQADNERFAVLTAKKGFRPVRHFFAMRRPFDTDIAEPLIPEGLRLVPFDVGNVGAVREAHNEAFLDHWGFTPRDQAFWDTWMTGSRAFRAHLSFQLKDGDRVVAYINGYEYEAETIANGVREAYIGQVGTLRDYRGRGAAKALILATMRAARELGFERASLGVDAANPTGALGLYERLGFAVFTESISYEKPL